MRHILFYFFFSSGFYGANSQCVIGTDFYRNNKQLCDDVMARKMITDSGRALVNYTTGYVMGKVKDSFAIVLGGYKVNPDSLANIGYATVYSRNKARDSVQNNIQPVARAALSAGTGISYNSTTGAITNTVALPTRSFNNAPSPTIQTVAAAGNGDQLSSTRDASVSYSATLVSTATIAGNASGYLVLEICPTNSSTAGNWIEIGRVPNGQAVSLAITLQSVSTGGGCVTGIVPAGYYRRLRSITTSGSPTFTFNSGQEVLL